MNPQLPLKAAWLSLLLLALSATTLLADSSKTNADKKTPLKAEGVVSGLMTDFKNDSMIVQLDDQDEPTKFVYGDGITLQGLTKRAIFPTNRINFKYKTQGDVRTVVAVEKINGRSTGVVIGKVIKVYNNFWVSVKPNNGAIIEGFALGANAKENGEILKSLTPGDTVAIQYATDFERHRIQKIEVKPTAGK